MAIDFPASPTLNVTYTFGGRTWKWNGTAWESTSSLITLDNILDVTISSPANGQLLKYNSASAQWVNGADNIQVGITAVNEIDTSAGNLIIDSFGGTTTVDDNLIVSGDLTVNGTTTTINTTTLNVSDNIVILNNDVTGTPTENAGIEVERGTSANVLVRWNETNDKWEATNDGSIYGNIVTTADTGTVTSTMIADGTIVNADVNASAAIAHSKLANATAGQVLLGTTTTGVVTATTVSGDVTITGAGVTTIGANKVTASMFANSVYNDANLLLASQVF